MCKKQRYILVLIACVSLAALALSCKTTPAITTPTEVDEATIYAVVTRQLATVDDTFGGNLKPPTLYVIRNTDDKAGDWRQESMSVLISQTVQDKVTAALGDLSAEIIWIDRFVNAEFEDTPSSMVKGGGAIITLGNIYQQADDSVYVAGSIYIGNLGAGGTTYVLKKIDGIWKITGTIGAHWMSRTMTGRTLLYD